MSETSPWPHSTQSQVRSKFNKSKNIDSNKQGKLGYVKSIVENKELKSDDRFKDFLRQFSVNDLNKIIELEVMENYLKSEIIYQILNIFVKLFSIFIIRIFIPTTPHL